MAESPSIATVVSTMLRHDLVSTLFGDLNLIGHPYINTFLMFLIFYTHECQPLLHVVRPSTLA